MILTSRQRRRLTRLQGRSIAPTPNGSDRGSDANAVPQPSQPRSRADILSINDDDEGDDDDLVITGKFKVLCKFHTAIADANTNQRSSIVSQRSERRAQKRLCSRPSKDSPSTPLHATPSSPRCSSAKMERSCNPDSAALPETSPKSKTSRDLWSCIDELLSKHCQIWTTC